MSKQKTAIVLTEHVEIRNRDREALGRVFVKKSVVVPITRIAKVEDCRSMFQDDLGDGSSHQNPAVSYIHLRTPEDSIFVGESIERVAALMNGETFADTAGKLADYREEG